MKAFVHCRTSSKAWRRHRLLPDDDDEEGDDDGDGDEDGDHDGDATVFSLTKMTPHMRMMTRKSVSQIMMMMTRRIMRMSQMTAMTMIDSQIAIV